MINLYLWIKMGVLLKSAMSMKAHWLYIFIEKFISFHNNMCVLWQTYLNKFRFVLLYFFLVFYVSIKVYFFRCWKGGLKYEWIFLNKKYYAYILHRKYTFNLPPCIYSTDNFWHPFQEYGTLFWDKVTNSM